MYNSSEYASTLGKHFNGCVILFESNNKLLYLIKTILSKDH